MYHCGRSKRLGITLVTPKVHVKMWEICHIFVWYYCAFFANSWTHHASHNAGNICVKIIFANKRLKILKFLRKRIFRQKKCSWLLQTSLGSSIKTWHVLTHSIYILVTMHGCPIMTSMFILVLLMMQLHAAFLTRTSAREQVCLIKLHDKIILFFVK